MLAFLESDICPNFVKADIKRGVQCHQQSQAVEDDNHSDNGVQYDSQQPDWMDLLQPCAYLDVSSDFAFDDGGPDFDWSHTSNAYPDDFGVKWLENLDSDEDNNTLELPNVDLISMNQDQRFAFCLVMDTLLKYKKNHLQLSILNWKYQVRQARANHVLFNAWCVQSNYYTIQTKLCRYCVQQAVVQI